MLLFLSSSEVSVALIIPSGHDNTNLPNKHFSHEHLLISGYLSLVHALLHSQSYVAGFRM